MFWFRLAMVAKTDGDSGRVWAVHGPPDPCCPPSTLAPNKAAENNALHRMNDRWLCAMTLPQ